MAETGSGIYYTPAQPSGLGLEDNLSLNLDAVVPVGDRTAPICMADIDDLAAGARRLIQRPRRHTIGALHLNPEGGHNAFAPVASARCILDADSLSRPARLVRGS